MKTSARPAKGFTLIELLIVVAIIAILAAIAVPNFLEAQTRAKVSRSKSDIRSLATAIEAYRVDHNRYPEGTDNPSLYPQEIADFLGDLAPGYYTFRTRSAAGTVGSAFFGVTTPIAYISTVPTDPFVKQAGGFLTYCYRNAKDRGNGYVITSFGPDADIFENVNGKKGAGTASTNPFSTAMDSNAVARLGDVNERDVIHYMEGTKPALNAIVDSQWGGMQRALGDLAYDPTNGTVSDGDLIFLGPGIGFVN